MKQNQIFKSLKTGKRVALRLLSKLRGLTEAAFYIILIVFAVLKIWDSVNSSINRLFTIMATMIVIHV